MSPIQIMILLGIYSSGQPMLVESPARTASIQNLLVADLIFTQDMGDSYGVTERGRCLVEHMKALPMPVQVTEWRMPA